MTSITLARLPLSEIRGPGRTSRPAGRSHAPHRTDLVRLSISLTVPDPLVYSYLFGFYVLYLTIRTSVQLQETRRWDKTHSEHAVGLIVFRSEQKGR